METDAALGRTIGGVVLRTVPDESLHRPVVHTDGYCNLHCAFGGLKDLVVAIV